MAAEVGDYSISSSFIITSIIIIIIIIFRNHTEFTPSKYEAAQPMVAGISCFMLEQRGSLKLRVASSTEKTASVFWSGSR